MKRVYENVNNGLVKNVEHIGKAEGGVEKYKRIWYWFQKATQCVSDRKRYLDNFVVHFMTEENKEIVIVDDKTIKDKR